MQVEPAVSPVVQGGLTLSIHPSMATTVSCQVQLLYSRRLARKTLRRMRRLRRAGNVDGRGALHPAVVRVHGRLCRRAHQPGGGAFPRRGWSHPDDRRANSEREERRIAIDPCKVGPTSLPDGAMSTVPWLVKESIRSLQGRERWGCLVSLFGEPRGRAARLLRQSARHGVRRAAHPAKGSCAGPRTGSAARCQRASGRAAHCLRNLRGVLRRVGFIGFSRPRVQGVFIGV